MSANRRALASWFVLGICLAPGVGALEGLHRSFDGVLRLQEPILIEGRISMDTEAGFIAKWGTRWSFGTLDEVAYRSEGTTVHVLVRRPPIGSVRPPFSAADMGMDGTPSAGGMEHGRSYVLRDHTIEFAGGPGPGEWALLPPSGGRAADAVLTAATACRLAPDPKAAIDAADDPATALSAKPWVRADCERADFQTGAWGRIVLNNVTLTVRWKDDEGRSHEEVIVTGTSDEGVDPLGYAKRPVSRRVLLEFTDPNATMSFVHARGLVLDAPALALDGQSRVPAATGQVQWGDWRAEGEIQPIDPRGTFLFRGAGEAKEPTVSMMGATENEVAGPDPDAFGPPRMIALAGAMAAAAVLWLLARRLGPLLVGLFSRMTREQGLDHDRRRIITELVTQNPGISVHEVVAQLGLARSVVNYHLGVLERHGILLLRKFGHRTGLFVRGSVPVDQEPAQWVLRGRLAGSLVAILEADPEITQAEIAQRLHVTQSRVSKLLGQLRRAGLTHLRTRRSAVNGPDRTAPFQPLRRPGAPS